MKKLIPLLFLLTTAVFAQAQLSKEQQQIKQTFFSFLKFYQKNENAFNRFDLYQGTGPEDGPPYKINWKETERYFAFLRKSVPFVGEAYIKAEKAHFRFSDSCFKDDPAEEMPVGFDYDRWAGGQESIDHTIKWYTSVKNIYEVKITGNTALLRIGAELYSGQKPEERSWSVVPFVKEKGKWKMADNVYPEFVEETPEN